ncbi:hypothetical protein [Ochrobactrum sp. AN78]|uniref:hypothetical protein n=1 Tax=Ochrobactrum sp. AN78 TaxID=3039853 RepID=UPI002989EE89|nr:hypothetical protein [Ochrobactrum sp. AN78]MDH7793548.1 hypothetical protein [Ochrobactrum sp. AN78]
MIAEQHRTCCFQSLGDSRSRAIAGLKDVFAAHPAFQAPARFDSFEQIIEGNPHEITQFFLGHYETACLSKRGINLLRERVHDGLEAHATDGTIRHVMRFMQMTIEKTGVARAVNAAATCGRLPPTSKGPMRV